MNTKRPHFTNADIERLLAATTGSRCEIRDRCLLLLMFRHGLRVSEAAGLTVADVDMANRSLRVKRLQGGLSTTHPLGRDEIRLLKAWLVERARMKPQGTTLFVSERRQPLSRKTVWVLVRRYGRLAGLSRLTHPQMLRHGCGYALAAQGAETRVIQQYLGHRYFLHTLKYTTARPTRFATLWKERS
jgi:site-specific recombinase XerD